MNFTLRYVRMKTIPNKLKLLAELLILILGLTTIAVGARAQRTQPNTSEAKPRLVTQLGHSGRITSVAFSHNNMFVLTGGDHGTAILWEVQTGKEIRRFKVLPSIIRDVQRQQYSVIDVAFSRDDQTLMTAGRDATIVLWETQTGKEIRRFRGFENSETRALFSPDGKYVMGSDSKGGAVLCEVESGKEVHHFDKYVGIITAVAISSDGKFGSLVHLGGRDVVWEIETDKEISQFNTGEWNCFACAFSPDSKRVLIAKTDNTA